MRQHLPAPVYDCSRYDKNRVRTLELLNIASSVFIEHEHEQTAIRLKYLYMQINMLKLEGNNNELVNASRSRAPMLASRASNYS